MNAEPLLAKANLAAAIEIPLNDATQYDKDYVGIVGLDRKSIFITQSDVITNFTISMNGETKENSICFNGADPHTYSGDFYPLAFPSEKVLDHLEEYDE
eukprot:Awhi_evm1s10633